MTISYQFLVDWDSDKFFCKDARPTDNVNLLPGAVRIDNLKRSVVGVGVSATGVVSTNPYGLAYLQFPPAASGQYIDIGYDGTNYDLSVTAGLNYAGAVWAKVTTGTLSVTLSLRRPSGSISSTTVTLNTSWQRIAVSNQTLVTETNLYLRLTANGAGTIQISGPMITQGAVPTAFNTGAVSRYENISAYVRDARWNVGFKTPFQYVSDWERASITLQNDSLMFSPEAAASPLYGYLKPQRRLVILAAANGGTETTMFTGWINGIKPMAGIKGARTCSLEAAGVRQFIDGVEVDVALQIGKTAEEVASAVMEKVNTPGGHDLTLTAPTPGQYDITYPYAADNWDDGIDILRALNDVIRARQGKIVFDRNGQYGFFGPQAYMGNHTSAIELNTVLRRIDYRYGEDIKNVITVMRYRRKISAATDVILWDADEDFVVEKGETLEIRGTYRNGNAAEEIDDNITVGGHNVYHGITPTGVLTTSVDPSAQSALITLTNNTANDVTVTKLRLRGQKITAFDEARNRAKDADSISQYGRISEQIVSKLVNKPREARRIARYRLAQFKDPQGIVRSIGFIANLSSDLEDKAVQYGISATTVHRVRVTDEQLQHDRFYALIGEEHHVTDSGKMHEVTWYLEPLANVTTIGNSYLSTLNSTFIGLY